MYGTYALFQIRQMPMQISMMKKRHYVTCCHVSAHVLPRQRPQNAY